MSWGDPTRVAQEFLAWLVHGGPGRLVFRDEEEEKEVRSDAQGISSSDRSTRADGRRNGDESRRPAGL